MTVEPRHLVTQYSGGIRVRYRWSGSGQGAAVFALSETGGELSEHGALAGPDFDQLCRAELRVETPGGSWSARLASPIFDDPAGLYWDVESLLVVSYGFVTYAFEARSGTLRWSHRSKTPILAVLGSSRLDHVIVQTEVETFAIDASGEVLWRVAHSDVVTAAELLGGQLVLTSYGGQTRALNTETGRPIG